LPVNFFTLAGIGFRPDFIKPPKTPCEMRAHTRGLRPWFAGTNPHVMGSTLPVSSRRLVHCLPPVALHAPSLAVRHVIPCASLADRNDVVSVHLTPMRHASTVNALPGTLVEHSPTPCPVCLVAVASSSCVWPIRIVTPGVRAKPGGPM
jgi:hypothetical protein